MQKFTATITVEAAQVSADWNGNDALLTWANATQIRDGVSLSVLLQKESDLQRAVLGDWIVKGIFGDYFVRSAKAFAKDYKAVE